MRRHTLNGERPTDRLLKAIRGLRSLFKQMGDRQKINVEKSFKVQQFLAIPADDEKHITFADEVLNEFA